MSKVKCLHCPIKRLPHQMEEHVLHCKKNKPYECDICGQCFPTAKGLGTHKGNFHTADERGTLFRCPYCPHGSDDKRAFDKHVSQHEESGGSGFRKLTRSRSREPARRSSVSNNSAASPIRRSSRARSCNSSAPRQRAPSRNFRETSTTTNSTNSTTMNWASMPPTTNNLLGNDTENRREAGSTAQGILPIRMVANGLLEIAVLNPEYAERRIAEYKRQFAATVNQLSDMNRRLREHCITEGIQLAPEDFVEEKIQALKAKYPQIYGEPSGQQ